MANEKKQKREMMRKRKHSLFKKAYELGKLCDADVAVIVRINSRFYTYRSTDKKSWPPSMEQIVSTALFNIKFDTDVLIGIANHVSTAGRHAPKAL